MNIRMSLDTILTIISCDAMHINDNVCHISMALRCIRMCVQFYFWLDVYMD